MSNSTDPTQRHPSNRRPAQRRPSQADPTETPPSIAPPSIDRAEARIAELERTLIDLAHVVTQLAECVVRLVDERLGGTKATRDPEAARRLGRHVPDPIDLTSGISNLALWVHLLRIVHDIERRHGTIR
jgi:hypothetical protein